MIKQLFNVKTLGAVLLTVFMVFAVSSYTTVQAQSTSITANQQGTTVDLDQLKPQLKSIVRDVERNTDYTHMQKEARVLMYTNIWDYAKTGTSLEVSIMSGWRKAVEYVDKLNNPGAVDIKKLLNEAENHLL